MGGGRAPDPGSPTPRQEAPPPPPRAPSSRPHSAQAQQARARAVGLVTGPHAHIRHTHSQWALGSGRPPQRTGAGGWGSARPTTPHSQARGAPPPPGALDPPPQRAKPARKSARCGVGDGSPRPHPPHPQEVGSGPWPHAPVDRRSGMGERPTPDAPHTGKRHPPPGALVPPPQHVRARAVGLVTGPHVCTPHIHSQWVVGPGPRPNGRAVGDGRALSPGRPTHGQEASPPLGALLPPPQHARARAVGLVTGPHAHTPRTHSQWVVGPGRPPERTGGQGGEKARPRTPHTQTRGAPPRAPLCRPHSAQSQLARARAVRLVTCPHAHSPPPTVSGYWAPAARPKGRALGGRKAPDPGRPTHRPEAPPPRRPRAAPTVRKASSQEHRLWGW